MKVWLMPEGGVHSLMKVWLMPEGGVHSFLIAAEHPSSRLVRFNSCFAPVLVVLPPQVRFDLFPPPAWIKRAAGSANSPFLPCFLVVSAFCFSCLVCLERKLFTLSFWNFNSWIAVVRQVRFTVALDAFVFFLACFLSFLAIFFAFFFSFLAICFCSFFCSFFVFLANFLGGFGFLFFLAFLFLSFLPLPLPFPVFLAICFCSFFCSFFAFLANFFGRVWFLILLGLPFSIIFAIAFPFPFSFALAFASFFGFLSFELSVSLLLLLLPFVIILIGFVFPGFLFLASL